MGVLRLAIIFTMCAHAADQVKLIVLDPGHFHASLVQKEMYASLDPSFPSMPRWGRTWSII